MKAAGFSLIELLVVVALIGLLSVILVPAVTRGVHAAKGAACASNLKQMYGAYVMYLDDHGGRFFKWREETDEGIQWYWGLETGGGGEGSRGLDKSRAKLASYFDHVGGVEICPSLPYEEPYFKPKFDIASYGYALNIYLIADTPPNRACGITRFADIRTPAETITWGDSAQVNSWQAPASPDNPMLEEWYYLSAAPPPGFHFRHAGGANMVMADGAVRRFEPAWLDPRCDGLTGYIEPRGCDDYLRPIR